MVQGAPGKYTSRPYFLSNTIAKHRRPCQIGDDVIFPASGYVAMAIEATSQYSERGGADASFKFENSTFRFLVVNLHHALVFVKGEKIPAIDLIFSLKPTEEARTFNFTISSIAHGRWTKHCSGAICYENCKPPKRCEAGE